MTDIIPLEYPWHSADEPPAERGWYEVRALDDRWQGESRYRAWGCGDWWIPLGDRTGDDGWMSGPTEGYEWRGPAFDVMGPSPATDEEMAGRDAGGREVGHP
jgi:hypothetical protein